MNTTWLICYDCKARLDRRDRTRQTYTAGLELIEVVSDVEAAQGVEGRSRISRYRCGRCGLQWSRSETYGAARAATAYSSELTPRPTDDQTMAIAAWVQDRR